MEPQEIHAEVKGARVTFEETIDPRAAERQIRMKKLVYKGVTYYPEHAWFISDGREFNQWAYVLYPQSAVDVLTIKGGRRNVKNYITASQFHERSNGSLDWNFKMNRIWAADTGSEVRFTLDECMVSLTRRKPPTIGSAYSLNERLTQLLDHCPSL